MWKIKLEYFFLFITVFSQDLQKLRTSQCCKCRSPSGTLLRAPQRPGCLRIRGQLGGVNSLGAQCVEHYQACPEQGEGKHSYVAWCCPWLQPACHPGLREDVHWGWRWLPRSNQRSRCLPVVITLPAENYGMFQVSVLHCAFPASSHSQHSQGWCHG